MKWSWKLGKAAGIGIYVHATFLLLIAWVAFVYWQVQHRWDMALAGVEFTLALFVCVLFHEIGHALCAKKFGVETRDITLLPIGGVAHLEKIPEEPKQELLVALAGPGVTLAIILLLAGWIALKPPQAVINPNDFWAMPFSARLMAVNVFLLLFNLLPAFPMDGGRVIRALLAMRLGRLRATRIAAVLGQTFAFVFGAIGLFTNPFLILIALFVWVGAASESRMTSLKSVFEGIPVSRAMFTDFHALSPDDKLSRPVELIQRTPQQDFPVVENGDVAGILTWNDLLAALAEHKSDFPVRDFMRRKVETVRDADPLESAVARLQSSGVRTLPVVRDGGELVGLLTLDSIGEFMAVASALGGKA